MLSLVNYESSGESENGDDSEDNLGTNPVQSKVPLNETGALENKDAGVTPNCGKDSISDEEDVTADKPEADEVCIKEDSPLFSALPRPTAKAIDVSWDQLSKLTYKTGAVRILAPPLPEESNDDKKKEKRLPSKAGSGLLAVLPKPKNDFGGKQKLVPHSVFKPKSLPPAKPKVPVKRKPVEKPSSDSENEDDAATSGGDFFSLSSTKDDNIPELPSADIDFLMTDSTPVSSSSSAPPEKSKISDFSVENDDSEDCDSSTMDYQGFAPNQELELDDNALMQLCGARGLKRRASEMRMIDVDGSQLIPNAQEMLTKNLTQVLPKPKSKGYGVTSQQKRKHQITYLAHQAKEQELELQNTWANNRMTKKQTQAKYGF